jgi:hypothetical protein
MTLKPDEEEMPNQILKHLAGLTFEQRFWSLRHEILRILNIVGPIAGLLKIVDTDKAKDLPEGYSGYVERLMTAIEELRDVANKYAPPEQLP